MSTRQPLIFWLDALIGVMLMLLGFALFGALWTVGQVAGSALVIVGVSTVFRWVPGMWAGCLFGVLFALAAIMFVLVSPSYKVSSGQPYPPVFFLIARFASGMAALMCFYPLWRKKINGAPPGRRGSLP